MDGDKKAVAGPSSGYSSASIFVDEEQEKKQVEVIEDLSDDEAAVGDPEDDDFLGNEAISNFVPGPLLPLKDQIEKDKDDESLRRWKEKLLGSLESDLNGLMEPQVKFHSIGIVCDDFGEINNPLTIDGGQNSNVFFTLGEGSHYRLKLSFTVLHNIVSGLTYTNTVWKGGIQVDRTKGMLGTFAPQKEMYVHTLDEETTPSGVLARGIYTANLKFDDDDRRCHMELKYSFEIKKRS